MINKQNLLYKGELKKVFAGRRSFQFGQRFLEAANLFYASKKIAPLGYGWK